MSARAAAKSWSSQHQPRSKSRNMLFLPPVPPLQARRPQVIRNSRSCNLCVRGGVARRGPLKYKFPCFRLMQAPHAFPVTLWGHTMSDMVCRIPWAGKACVKLLYYFIFAMCQPYYIYHYKKYDAKLLLF